ncbi:hypothetical protein PIB30_049965 [Stylosanthes scabra]|uniref:Uncharacterized protein n=1 Tax=Stylosanthes scabra TaxID=79078 RepID=A0ABU6XFA7_9FABA|nr:hypothetical protein [Stylosanthes scabra]
MLKGTRRLPVAAIIRATYDRLQQLFVRKGRESEAQMNAGMRFSQTLLAAIERSRKDLCKMRVTHCDRMGSVFSVEELEELSGLFGWQPPTKAVPVCKLIGPPFVIATGRGAEEPVHVHMGHGDGLLTAKPPLHSIGVMKPNVHEKNNRHCRKPCLDLARLVYPGGLDGAPLRTYRETRGKTMTLLPGGQKRGNLWYIHDNTSGRHPFISMLSRLLKMQRWWYVQHRTAEPHDRVLYRSKSRSNGTHRSDMMLLVLSGNKAPPIIIMM